MGKPAGTKVQVTEYYMSQHFGICTAVDELRRIIVKEKVAWKGSLTDQTSFLIQEDNLFGGATKEGGATGTIYYLPGAADQVLPDILAQRLGRANGADAPGYRGICSLFFTGRPDVNEGVPGFYWTANNPYLPGVWAEVRRAPKGLNPAYALVPRADGGIDAARRYSQSDDGGAGLTYTSPMTTSPLSTLMIRYAAPPATSPIEWWDLPTRTLIGISEIPGPPHSGIENLDIAADGTAYGFGQYTVGVDVFSALWSITPLQDAVRTESDRPGAWLSAPTRVFDVEGGHLVLTGLHPDYETSGYLEGGQYQASAHGLARDFCLANGKVATLYEPVGSSADFTIERDGVTLTVTGLVTRSEADTAAAICHVPTFSHYFVVTDSKFYCVDDASGAIKTSGVYTLKTNTLPRKSAAVSFWVNGSTGLQYLLHISLEDGSTIETIAASEWVADDIGGPVAYDYYNGAMISVAQADDDHLTWRYFEGLDANPAHMIYECLTNTDWGMGSPTSLIDTDNFNEVGVVLYNEPLGLSMIWTRQATAQDFIQQVLDHIQGALFIDPQTGLLTLKLIRGDYDVETLPTIDPSNANLTNFNRKLWGEIVNEITVTWTNPETEQDETVTVQDLASIVTQGGIITDGRNYYGVRYASLAQRLGARDLRSAGAPLATFEAEVDRSFWFLRPASVLRADWPEHGLDGVVVRVVDIDYGKPGDARIKLSLIEDVFGIDAGDYVEPAGSSWVDPAQPPTAMTDQAILTLPYYFAANAITSLADATYPEVLAGVLGASSNADAFSYELWGEVTLPGGGTEWQALATLNVVGRGELGANIDAEATSTGVSFDSFIGAKRPVANGFAVLGVDAEATTEIALITAAGGTYDLSRGVFDTIPKAWAAGTVVWFVSADTLLEDPNVHSSAEVVSYQLRTRTSLGVLTSAPVVSATLTDRPWLPSRPANVEIEGVQFNDSANPVDMTARPNPWVTVSWSNRNRLNEDNVVLGWSDATVAPEADQTTTITIYADDGVTVIDTITGLTGTTHDIPDASFGSEIQALVVLTSSRTDADGTFESLQGQGIWVMLAPFPSTGLYVGGKTATVLSTDTGVISLTDLTGGLDTAPSAGDVVVIATGMSKDNVPPTSGIVTAGYVAFASGSATDVYRCALQMAAKGMGATPDPSVSVVVPADSGAYCTVGIEVWRDVVAVLDDQVASGSNYGRPNPPSITTPTGNIIVAAGVAAGPSIPVVTSSDLDNFESVASGSGTTGIGSKVSTGPAFDAAEFGGGDTSGNSSWVAIAAALLSDDGALTDTPVTLETATTGSGSTSAFAAKGSIYAFHSKATLVDVAVNITPSGSETYKLVVAELDRSNVIIGILGSSAPQTFSTGGSRTYTLSSPVDIQLGARIAFIMVRTDGTSTSINRIMFPTSAGIEDARMGYIGCVRYASTNPAVSDSVFLNNTSVARMTIGYEYPA